VIAERIANDLKERVVVIDKRPHIGGNCFSEDDKETGIHYHKYGTHIFHTSNKIVWDYINRFTEFNGYFHQVLTTYKNRVYQMPINLETINAFYNLNLKPYEVDGFLEKEIAKEKISSPKNFEEKAISLIGRPLYEAFIKGYTKKQWQKDPTTLPESILKRLPFRKNYNESYYFSRWQGIPLMGYTEIFRKLLNNKIIEVKLNTDYFEIRRNIPETTFVIYSGPIDKYFDYKYGKLEWRTLEFKKRILQVEDYQGTSVMNYAEESIPYTRIHEPRHLHAEKDYTKEKTLIIEEYSKSDDENNPYYPVNDEKNQKLILKYNNEKQKLNNVAIGGRLGDYKYYDMHQTIAMALELYENKIKRNFRK
jgi:UDP-galactopyranose mutase